MTATFSENTAPPRLAAIDVARGGAVYIMALYHLAWDLNDFKFTSFALFTDPFWLGARTVIVSAFLFLAGLSLVLADRRGRGWLAFGRRVAVVAVGAGLVSLGTWFMFSTNYVFFGVLHCIAVSSLIVLPFLRWPAWVAALVGLDILVAPMFLSHSFFDQAWLQWVGLVTQMPQSVDYVPLFPWTGVIMLGVAYGLWQRERPAGSLSDWHPNNAVSDFTAWLGRHSLVVYIVHQPLLIGLVWLAAKLIR
jgi:uncharacterized membrane protein